MSAHGSLLCIDDDPGCLKIRKMLLETFGYKVSTSTSGREGLNLLRSRAFDAVLVDYQMPGMNGDQVAREIRRLHPEIPIMMVSAYNTLPDSVTRFVNAFVCKTEPAQYLARKIEQLLALRTPTGGDPLWVLGGALAIAAFGGLAFQSLYPRLRGRKKRPEPVPSIRTAFLKP